MTHEKATYYKTIVKRHLCDILSHLTSSKNKMERNYYQDRYDAQLDYYAMALGLRTSILRKFIKNTHN